MILNRYWFLEITICLAWLAGLFAAGLYWLWLHRLLWLWLVISGLAASLVFVVHAVPACRRARQLKKQALTDAESRTKSALQDLQALTEELQRAKPDLFQLEFYFDTFYRVVKTVAERFYPEQKNAYLEIKIPYFIRVVELLAHDMRLNLVDNVPASHMLSLRQIVSAHQYAGKGMRYYGFFRRLARGIPIDLGRLNNLKAGSKAELADWFVELYVRKIGQYAIQTYRAQLSGTEQLKVAGERTTSGQPAMAEPLRILLLGQTGSGKSSCINALFGQAVAEADVLPATQGLTAYLLHKTGLNTAIIYDSEGYAGDGNPPLAIAGEEVLRCDMILLSVSAVNPARDCDYRVIQAIEAQYAAANRLLPPIVVVLTHIDQLRPWREWWPPYDIANPDNDKAGNIRLAMQAVAEELGLGLAQIAPVCLKPGRLYNVEEGLLPTLLQNLDRAKQVCYLRCVGRYREEDYWRRLWRQSKNSGRFIARELARTLT